MLESEPRIATVRATSEAMCMSIDRKTFIAILGPLEDMLKRGAAQRKWEEEVNLRKA